MGSMIRQIKEILKTRLSKNILTVFVMDNIANAVGMLTTFILIRMLSKDDYALYTFFWAATVFFTGFMSSGIDMAYVRFAAEEYSVEKKMPRDIFLFSIILFLIVSLVVLTGIIIFKNQLALLLFKSGLYSGPIVLGCIASIGMFLTEIGTRYYQVQEKYGKAGILMNLQKFCFFFFVIILIAAGNVAYQKVAPARTLAITGFGILLIGIIAKNDLLKKELLLRFSRFMIFVRVSFWLILYCVSVALFSQLDVFMISRFMAVEDLAEYGVALRYYGVLMLMFPAIKTVLKVRTSQTDMVGNPERQRIFFKKWMKAVTPPALILLAGAVLCSDFFMNLLNGPRYVASIFPFKVLAVSAVLSYVFSPNTDIFRAMNKYFLLFCFGMVGLIVNFFGNLVLIPHYGIAGAAMATLAAYLIVNGSATGYVLMKA